MAPSAIEVETVTVPPNIAALKLSAQTGPYKEIAPTKYDKEAELTGVEGHAAAKYPHYLPTWDRSQKYPPLQPFEHYEHGKDADTTFPNLLPEGTKITHLTPTIGTEVNGIQLSKLTNAGKDELARFVAERKVIAFRNQDFRDLTIEQALEYGSYFGRYVTRSSFSLFP